MIALTCAERYAQASLYASQVRTRKAMGDRYMHFKPDNRKLRWHLTPTKTQTEILAVA